MFFFEDNFLDEDELLDLFNNNKYLDNDYNVYNVLNFNGKLIDFGDLDIFIFFLFLNN